MVTVSDTSTGNIRDPRAVRRDILSLLYAHYREDPLDMLGPEDFFAAGMSKEELVFNIHYLSDRKLVELMLGYQPPLFVAARLTADGIDLVENRSAFNLRFPPEPGTTDEAGVHVPALVEKLVEEADLTPLEGETRRALIRDVQYLRDEVARPYDRWRWHVVASLIAWIAAEFEVPGEAMPSLPAAAQALRDAAPLEHRDQFIDVE